MDAARSLISGLKRGDQIAFKELYTIYKNKLYFYCLKHTQSEEIASEILQDTFVKVWNTRANINEDLNFEAYLFKLFKNTLINHLKAENIRKVHEQEAANNNLIASNNTEEKIILNDYKKLLDKAIESLPPKRRQVYKLSRQSGMTYNEIAQTLNISTNTVENHIVKALRDIRSYIEEHSDRELLLGMT